MNIYFVTRWGNDTEGPDEEDTNFIVLASNYESAAEVVDNILIKAENSKAALFSQRITDLGASYANIEVAKILLGPSIENALYHDDIGIPDSMKWVRFSTDEGWLNFSDCYED